MTLCMLSASVVTNRWTLPCHVIQAVDLVTVESPLSRGNVTYSPCRLFVKQPEQIHQLLAKHRKNLKPKTVAFAIVNGKGEAERGNSSDTSSNYFMASEYTQSSEFPDAEAELSDPKTKAYACESVDDLHSQGSALDKLKAVRFHVLASEKWNASRLKLCDRKYLANATNLIHYLALKSLDIEHLEEDLTSLGLLSLDMISSNVLASLNTAIRLLENFQNAKENFGAETWTHEKPRQQKSKNFTIQAMKKKASSNKESLLGQLREGSSTHIMVTVGKEATENENLITDLLKAGASVIRINCAHGDPGIWSEIIRRVRRSSQMLEIPCRILMDLAGPKLRTGSLNPGPCVMKISPKKNAFGNVVFPAQVWLSQKGVNPPPHLCPDATLFIDDDNSLTELEVGDTLKFYDARGKNRVPKISRKFHVFSGTGFLAECPRTAYIQSGTEFHVKRKKRKFFVGQVVDIPPKESFVRLKVGDLLVISKDGSFGEPSVKDSTAHKISCSSGYLFDSVKPGEPIAFDDGKIWGRIQGTSPSEIVVAITHAGPKGTKLGSEKSINIPESNIRFEGLTSKDLKDLEFVASHADLVGISFVRDVCDIIVLRKELEKKTNQNLGVVLKIETRSGVERLPLIMLEAMKCSNQLGVMIARGDLAVECGWEKLADLQEEIMAICRASHVPVIWATQVLESLVKSGVPTRAEITDAANGRRANCVMLNKGKHIIEAVSTLDTILHAKPMHMKSELKPMLLCSHLL